MWIFPCLLITLISNIDQTPPGERKGKLRWQPIVSGIIGVGLVSVLCSSILVSGLWSTFPNFQSGFPLNFQFLHPHYYSASFLNMASLSVSHALYAITIPAHTIAALFFPFRSLSQTQNLVYIRFWHFYRDRYSLVATTLSIHWNSVQWRATLWLPGSPRFSRLNVYKEQCREHVRQRAYGVDWPKAKPLASKTSGMLGLNFMHTFFPTSFLLIKSSSSGFPPLWFSCCFNFVFLLKHGFVGFSFSSPARHMGGPSVSPHVIDHRPPSVCVHHISPSSFTLSCKILSFFIKPPFPQYGQRS